MHGRHTTCWRQIFALPDSSSSALQGFFVFLIAAARDQNSIQRGAAHFTPHGHVQQMDLRTASQSMLATRPVATTVDFRTARQSIRVPKHRQLLTRHLQQLAFLPALAP